MAYIFAVNLEWKGQPIDSTARVNESPQSLGTLNLEITLKTSVADSYNGPRPKWPSPNEHYLTKAAFQPRIFAVSIEKGNFIPDSYIGMRKDGYNPQWGLRLVFDKSPYPAQEGLAHPANSYDCSNRFDKIKTCVARGLKQHEKIGKAMNDSTFTFGDLVRPFQKMLGIEVEDFHMCGTCTPVFGMGWEGEMSEGARKNCPNR